MKTITARILQTAGSGTIDENCVVTNARFTSIGILPKGQGA